MQTSSVNVKRYSSLEQVIHRVLVDRKQQGLEWQGLGADWG